MVVGSSTTSSFIHRWFQMEYVPYEGFAQLPIMFCRDHLLSVGRKVKFIDPVSNSFHVNVHMLSDKLFFTNGWKFLKDVYNLVNGAWLRLFPLLYVKGLLKVLKTCYTKYKAQEDEFFIHENSELLSAIAESCEVLKDNGVGCLDNPADPAMGSPVSSTPSKVGDNTNSSGMSTGEERLAEEIGSPFIDTPRVLCQVGSSATK
ncbi:DNA-binding barrel domain superfamily [Sesbania bispinosa]|nr:DNA-binding barrel domain superfamily [Sesbania bispinosa]